MRWKFCLPEPWISHDSRVAYEEMCVQLENPQEEQHTYWLSLEALQSRTGGTREDKLRRLGEREYIIDDTLEMLVRRDDFDRNELVEWIREFIRTSLGDPEPILTEVEREELPGAFCLPPEELSSSGISRHTRLLIVQGSGSVSSSVLDGLTPAGPRLELHSVAFDETGLSLIPTTEVTWADFIIVMDKKIRSLVHKQCRKLGLNKRIICLHLPGRPDISSPEYAQAVLERLRIYFHRLGISGS